MQISCKEPKSDGVCKALLKLLRGTRVRGKKGKIIFNTKSSQEYAQGLAPMKKKNQSLGQAISQMQHAKWTQVLQEGNKMRTSPLLSILSSPLKASHSALHQQQSLHIEASRLHSLAVQVGAVPTVSLGLPHETHWQGGT